MNNEPTNSPNLPVWVRMPVVLFSALIFVCGSIYFLVDMMTTSTGPMPGRFPTTILFLGWLGLGAGWLWLLDRVMFPRIAKMIAPKGGS